MADFNLKYFREEVLNITQKELADLLEISRDKIVRLENNPEKIELGTLIMIADKTGQSLDQLTGYRKEVPSSFTVDNTLKQVINSKLILEDEISKISKQSCFKNESNFLHFIDEFKKVNYIEKPKIAVIGMSDAGKTTFINSLLGEQNLPAYWTPATATNTYVKHISDRPNFIEHDVVIMNNEEDLFQLEKINEHTYFEKNVLNAGGIELLEKFGTRKGENYEEDKNISIIVYLESDVLEVCDLIDVPGFGTGDRTLDDTIANSTRNIADVLIYLSISNGFLRGEEIQFLRTALNVLPPIEREKENTIPPLGNLFVVASQAITVNQGDVESLNYILDKGAERLLVDINTDIWEKKKDISGYDYTYEELRKRFFTFATDKQDLRKWLEQDLKELLEKIPFVLANNYKLTMSHFLENKKNAYSKDIEHYQNLFNLLGKNIREYHEYSDAYPRFQKEKEETRKEVIAKIRNLEAKSIKEFKGRYESIINEDHIVQVIRDNGYKKKKEDLKRLSGYMASELESKLEKVLKENSIELSENLEMYFDKMEEEILVEHNIQFDIRAAFTGGLAGVATFGALAFWASTFGNLGAYIMVAKTVSLLSALGLTTIGTATAASFVASIGGPVTLGLTLATVASISTFTIASGTWKKSIGKKIVKEYNKQDSLKKYKEVIQQFWQDTEEAFEQAVIEVDKKFKEAIFDKQREIATMDKEYIKQQLNYSELVFTKIKDLQDYLEKEF